MHSALLISRLVSISSRKPLSPGRIFVVLDEDGTSSFISSLHLRPAVPLRISWTAIEPRSPLGLRAGLRSPKLPSAAFSVFLSLSSALPGFPVHRCHPSPSSPATFFVHGHLARSSAASLFLLSHSRFRSVGLWGRKNERASERMDGRTDERTNGRTDATGEVLLSLSHRSLALGRSPLVRSFAYSLAQSLGHPSSPSLFAGSVYLLIATSPRLPRADRGLRQFPHPSRVPRFPRPCLILQQQQQQHRALRGASVPLSCSLFALSRSLRFLSFPFFLALSFGYLSFAPVDPYYVLFHSKLHSPSLSRPTFIRVSSLSLSFSIRNLVVLLPPTLDTNSLDAAEFSFEATIRGLRYIPTSTSLPPSPPPPPSSLLPHLDVDVDLSASLISRGELAAVSAPRRNCTVRREDVVI